MDKIFALFVLLGGFTVSEAANCNATSDVTSLTLNKFLKTFKVLVLKFDNAYPYGDQHDAFCKFAHEAAEVNDVFVGEVGMKEYGDRENMDFAESYGITTERPSILLIYTAADGEIVHKKFKNRFTAEKIRVFTYEHTRVYIPRPGCIHVFDLLALKFAPLEDHNTKEVVLKEAKKEALSQTQSGRYYIKVMEKVLSEGNSFIQSEADRLNKILNTSDKLSDQKTTLLSQRLNILRSFNVESNVKNEL
ncbi:ERP29 [Lepeophtheirus salmonis]|uniref:ERP29 n=2 Tax=Lepeophtheirus salmonis TaxID=72036 RepID=A0A7R8CLC5_LEPSM|nr:ERP29 [Lepeophtheirus salmonis]CAF2854372.1 ERP29 [Lepeophtheirus salmonis]